jgi:GNAT superfamily N-acetyltransferase
MSLEIRPASPRDAEPIATLYLAARRIHLPYAPLAHSEAEVRRWVAEILLPAGRSWVLSQAPEGAVLGFLSDAPEEPDVGNEGGAWIEQLYVHPAHTGQGLGTRLLRHALARLPRPLRLYTFEPNAGARRFYERHGFVLQARGDGSGNEEGCPDLLMALRDKAL